MCDTPLPLLSFPLDHLFFTRRNMGNMFNYRDYTRNEYSRLLRNPFGKKERKQTALLSIF